MVDDPPLRIQHEAHRQNGRDRGHGPGNDEDQRQPLDPGPGIDEETGQHQRDEHFQVHGDANENRGIHQRPRKNRVFKQPHIAGRIAREPEPVGNRIQNERDENDQIGGNQEHAPGLPGRETRLGS